MTAPLSPRPAESLAAKGKPETPVPAAKLPAIRLHLEAADLCWIQYTLDHQPTQEVQLQPGGTLDLKAEQTALLLVGNAGGLRVQYNEQWMKTIGPAGRPARLAFPLPTKQPSPPPPPRPSP
jgi:cytoskeleton protein RodZ